METTTLMNRKATHLGTKKPVETGATSTNMSRALWALRTAVVAAIALQAVTAQPVPYSAIISPEMNTFTIQQVIKNSNGAVYFKPGLYRLTGPLPLMGDRTYIGGGSADPRTGSVLMQTAPPDPITHLGTPIFQVDGYVGSVIIKGLTFDGTPGMNARGIAAANPTPCGDHKATPAQLPCALLVTSTISDNFFLTGLAECIDTPMEITVIERNRFGAPSVNGGWIGSLHRHIRSVFPDVVHVFPDGSKVHLGEGLTTAVRVTNNLFTRAMGSESVLVESGAQLQVGGNDFRENDTDTALQINGMSQVVIEGNRFEGNRGKYIMHFARARHRVSLDGEFTFGNHVVRARNNFYDMQRHDFIFTIDANSDDHIVSGAHVFMGDESGVHFTHRDGTAADLTDPVIAACYNTDPTSPSYHLQIYLSIVGPFKIPDYKAKNPNCCGPTETTACK